MTVAYYEEPRRGRPRFGPRTKACSLCGEVGHMRNSAIHRADRTPPVDPEGDVTPVVARLRDGRIQRRTKTIPATAIRGETKRLASLAVYEDDPGRPRTRGDCANVPRPCPYVSCSAHLYLDASPETGALKFNFPHLEPWEMKESCALDVADRGGAVLEEVGALTGLTRERIRQIEERTIRKIRTVAPELAEAGTASIELASIDDRLGRR